MRRDAPSAQLRIDEQREGKAVSDLFAPCSGKVVKVNATARFVVLSFPVGHLPAMEQRLNVTRRGLKVGEVKITGPQQEENIVADIVAGDAEEGDEVIDK